MASALPPRNHVDIWLCFESDVDVDLLRAYAPLLTDAERAKAARFYFPADRNRHVTSRALLRTVLPAYLGIPQRELRFLQDGFGRPHLGNPQARACALDFNLSHTAGLIALAVTTEGPVGVDVENISYRQPAIELASRFFSPDEVTSLHAFSGAALDLQFYRHWTLKESYLKAYGVGLSLPLDRFGFRLAGQEADFYLASAVDGRADTMSPAHDADDWCFAQWRASPDHLLAVCLRSDATTRPVFKLIRVTPLVSAEMIELSALCRSMHPNG